MATPDYINWPTGGPHFDREHPLAQGAVLAMCFAPQWGMGFKAIDLSPRGNDGTLTGMDPPTDWTARGLDFDGANDDFVNCASRSSVELENVFTLSCFCRHPDAYSVNLVRGLFNKHKTVGNKRSYTMFIFHFGGLRELYAYCSDDGTSDNLVIIHSNSDITPNVWHHLAITFEAGRWRTYVDGIAKLTAVGAAVTVFPNGEPLYVGRGFSDREWNGQIAQAMMHKRVLDAEEIAQLAADPLGLFRRRRVVSGFVGRARPLVDGSLAQPIAVAGGLVR